MRTARYYGKKDVRVENQPKTPTGDTDVMINIAACGICGSDLHEYTMGPRSVPSTDPHPLTKQTLPVPLGHEFGGEVVEIGTNVSDFSIGDTVAVNPFVSCGDCRYCNAGKNYLCSSIGVIGLSHSQGGFSEFATVPAENTVPFPDDVPAEYAALVEPFSVGLHAVRKSLISPGDSVAVFGAGPIGLTIIQLANLAGAAEIFTIEPQVARRELAGSTGSDIVLDPSEANAVETVKEMSNGGVDVAFEAAGIGRTVQDAINSTKFNGTTTIASVFEDQIELDANTIVRGERSVMGTFAYEAGPRSRFEFGTVGKMFSDGKLDPESLISSRIDLGDIVNNGFEALLDADRKEIKVLVEP
jgi:(R,R)-butanediol dehydrogenase/meso-butanediol dehydrogenase/diacetyl reductase